MADIEHVRVPDEVLFPLNALCERWPKVATMQEGGGVELHNLKPQEQVVLDLLPLISYVNEILDNINFVMSDLGQLALDARVFGDRHPFSRYKLLVRTFFYEYGRFEDAFGYYTLWFQKRGYISKEIRRELRHTFFMQIEHVVKIRNVCLHDDPNWSKSLTPEISILHGLDMSQAEVRNKKGELLEWEPHLGPLCLAIEASFYESAARMRTTWNMILVRAVEALIDDGKLKKAKKRFIPKKTLGQSTRLSEPEILLRDLQRVTDGLKRHHKVKTDR